MTIGRGDGTGARQWRRGGLLLLGVVAVVAAMTVATRGDGTESAAPEATTTTSRPRTTTTTERSTTTSPPSTIGQLLGERTDVMLLVQNQSGAVVVDLDTGKTRRLDGVRGGPPMAWIPAPAGVVVQGGAEAQFLPAPFDGQSTVLGAADWVVRSATPGRVWLLRTVETGTTATEVSVDGSAVGPTLEIPPPAYPVVAVEGGLLVEAFGRIYEMTADGVSPVATGSTVAVSEQWLALQGCDDQLRCGLTILNRETGETSATELPGDLVPGYFTGSFSPDGRHLAVWVQSNAGGPPRLLVVDAAARIVENLPTAGTSEWGNPPAWSPSGEWLFWVDSGIRAYDMRAGGPPVEVRLDRRTAGSGFYAVFAF